MNEAWLAAQSVQRRDLLHVAVSRPTTLVRGRVRNRGTPAGVGVTSNPSIFAKALSDAEAPPAELGVHAPCRHCSNARATEASIRRCT